MLAGCSKSESAGSLRHSRRAWKLSWKEHVQEGLSRAKSAISCAQHAGCLRRKLCAGEGRSAQSAMSQRRFNIRRCIYQHVSNVPLDTDFKGAWHWREALSEVIKSAEAAPGCPYQPALL